ncbi:transient receptor potential cation channel subfamily A member 1-like [Trachypithecus francoisi]|uniref:transient receptor potential cation channel subfamily A member 1-like n=1 Tax=Trachypithecus francoisi TaxID=54180 RepID=UPI00141B1054|nr:transient receptor potential cation channel subfamily A member 1-like [Trachypithecus francoisi]
MRLCHTMRRTARYRLRCSDVSRSSSFWWVHGLAVRSKAADPHVLNAIIMDDYGNSLLHCAVEENQIESVKFLLSRGANPNLRNFNMMAPLHLAVRGTHNEVMKVLLEHRTIDINLEGENGNTALIIACTTNNSEALQILAVLSGSKECMEIILKFGEEHGYSRRSHISFVNNGKASPLHLAVQNGDLEMIKMCLDNGAQIDLVEGEARSWKLFSQGHCAVPEGRAVCYNITAQSFSHHPVCKEYLLMKWWVFSSIYCLMLCLLNLFKSLQNNYVLMVF